MVRRFNREAGQHLGYCLADGVGVGHSITLVHLKPTRLSCRSCDDFRSVKVNTLKRAPFI